MFYCDSSEELFYITPELCIRLLCYMVMIGADMSKLEHRVNTFSVKLLKQLRHPQYACLVVEKPLWRASLFA